jgi:hypothetical protein
MRPWALGSEGAKSTDGHGRRGQERCADRPKERYIDRSAQRLAADLPFQDACSLSSSPSSPGPGSDSVVPRASVLVGGVALAVDAVGIDLEQDHDAVPRHGGRPRWRAPRSSATATLPRAADHTGGGWAATCTGPG